jgi:hypothetical protein
MSIQQKVDWLDVMYLCLAAEMVQHQKTHGTSNKQLFRDTQTQVHLTFMFIA